MNNIEDIISKVGELKVTELAELVKAMEKAITDGEKMSMKAEFKKMTLDFSQEKAVKSLLFQI